MLLALVKFLMQVRCNCQENPGQKQYYFHFGNKTLSWETELTELRTVTVSEVLEYNSLIERVMS